MKTALVLLKRNAAVRTRCRLILDISQGELRLDLLVLLSMIILLACLVGVPGKLMTYTCRIVAERTDHLQVAAEVELAVLAFTD
jgi:hypothetical protein